MPAFIHATHVHRIELVEDSARFQTLTLHTDSEPLVLHLADCDPDVISLLRGIAHDPRDYCGRVRNLRPGELRDTAQEPASDFAEAAE